METVEKIKLLNAELINKMMEKFGITYDDIISNLDENNRWIIDEKDWYDYYTFENGEYEEFKDWAIKEIKRIFKTNKKKAESEFSWWYLNFGLSTKQ